jgi:MFS family permease
MEAVTMLTCNSACYAGPFGDRFVLWKARRSNGIMEPEYRLHLFAAVLVLVPGGMLLWGLGAAHSLHWIGPVFAMGILSGSVAIGAQLTINYCIDSYKAISDSAIVSIMLIRNTMSFAVGYGVTPWVTNMGFQNAFLVAAFVALAQISLYFAMIKWGQKLRARSADKYWRYVARVEAEGLH